MMQQWVMEELLKKIAPHTLTSYWEEVKSIVSPENRWVAGRHCLDSQGQSCMHWNDDAARFSLYGAMSRTMYHGEKFGRTYRMDGLTTPIAVFRFVVGMHPIVFEAVADYKRTIEALDKVIIHCKQKGL